jgi:1-deoxy-D-xylulose-5-phosphate reductoisomerase
MKRIVLLGSTGSIGRNALDVVSRHPDQFRIVGLSARRRIDLLARQCDQHPEALFALSESPWLDSLLRSRPELKPRAVGSGEAALTDLVRAARPDLVVNALVGFVGLRPTIAALGAGIPVAVANKESIVTGGEVLLEAAARSGARLIPIDSEHVAISQCLGSAQIDAVERVVITASGGALRDRPLNAFADVTVEEVLAHPTWKMGDKITVDSATLVNKALETIEAHWLFRLPFEKIDVVIHPQSIVHSFVEFIDGSIMAQMGDPDMRFPILYALSYPERLRSGLRSSVTAFPALTFREVDSKRYPCFGLALEAARAGGNAPTVLNAANEMAVRAFLDGEIPFTGMGDVIEGALGAVERRPIRALEDILETDRITREWVENTYAPKWAAARRGTSRKC